VLAGGHLHVPQLRRVRFDVEEFARLTRASGLPFGDEGLWRWQPGTS
jgi:hypothetical protein